MHLMPGSGAVLELIGASEGGYHVLDPLRANGVYLPPFLEPVVVEKPARQIFFFV